MDGLDRALDWGFKLLFLYIGPMNAGLSWVSVGVKLGDSQQAIADYGLYIFVALPFIVLGVHAWRNKRKGRPLWWLLP